MPRACTSREVQTPPAWSIRRIPGQRGRSTMPTVPLLSPIDQPESGPSLRYCPRCGHHRAGELRLCGYCRFDFETPMPDETAIAGPPTPSVRIVPSDAPPPPGTEPLGRNKRWLLLGPISLL